MPGIKIQINKPGVKQIGVWFVLMMVVCQALLASQRALAQGTEPPIPPAPTGSFVLDTLDWLTPDQEAEINAINKNLDADGIAQIAVVTLDDCGPDKKTFRYHLFNTWGIGHANDNDGLLILLCWYGGDKTRRSVEQEVGYGLENTLPSTLTDSIAQKCFVTAFQENHPGEGLVAMVKSYDSLLRKQQPVVVPPTSRAALGQPDGILRDAILIISGLIGLVMLTMIAVHVYRMRANNSPHLTKREKVQEMQERKQLFLLIATLIVFGVAVFFTLNFNFAIALAFGIVAELFIAAIANWSYRGRIKKNDPNPDTSWFASGHHSSGGSGDDGGGSGFGGGSSGGGGSSTGF